MTTLQKNNLDEINHTLLQVEARITQMVNGLSDFAKHVCAIASSIAKLSGNEQEYPMLQQAVARNMQLIQNDLYQAEEKLNAEVQRRLNLINTLKKFDAQEKDMLDLMDIIQQSQSEFYKKSLTLYGQFQHRVTQAEQTLTPASQDPHS